MEGKLMDKVALVTGGLRGIGKAIAVTLAQAGATMVVLDQDHEDAPAVSELRGKIETSGRNFRYGKADVTSHGEVAGVVEDALKTFGTLDILVNNAGGGMSPVLVEDLEERDWDRVLNVNLKGTYLCSKAVIPTMKRQRTGSIINISSQAGRSVGQISSVSYVSAKAGVIGFTRQLAMEVGPLGIRVNAIAPGLVLSGERLAKRLESYTEEQKRDMVEAIPLRRLGKPEDIGRAALFLASEDSSYITGAVIDVNGGRFML